MEPTIGRLIGRVIASGERWGNHTHTEADDEVDDKTALEWETLNEIVKFGKNRQD